MSSVREIAKIAGISKTTVSLVMRNQAGVSEKTRQRVYEAISHLRTLEEAQAAEQTAIAANHDLMNGISKEENYSLLVLHPSNIYSSAVFHEIIRGIQAAASLYKLQLNLAFNDSNLLGNNFETLYFSNPILRPKGILVIGARISEPVIDRVSKLDVPIVMVGRHAQLRGISSIGRDEEDIACTAAQYLINLGHRRIAFVGGSDKYSYTLERINGYRRAFCERNLPVPEDLIMPGFDEAATIRWILNTPDITAIMFINELYASQVLPFIKDVGKSIPEDLSVVCFDDTDISRNFDPPLTTVSFPFYQEGFWAVRMLIERIRQPMIVNFDMILGATLIKRKSCSPPKT